MTGLRSGVDDWRKKSGGWTSSRNSWDMFQCRHGELSKQQLLGGWRSVWQEVLNVPDVCHKPCFVLHFCQLLFVSHSCVKFSFHYGRFTNCREWWIEYGQLDVRWYKVILLVIHHLYHMPTFHLHLAQILFLLLADYKSSSGTKYTLCHPAAGHVSCSAGAPSCSAAPWPSITVLCPYLGAVSAVWSRAGRPRRNV